MNQIHCLCNNSGTTTVPAPSFPIRPPWTAWACWVCTDADADCATFEEYTVHAIIRIRMNEWH